MAEKPQFDPWVQVLALFVLFSGALTAAGLWTRLTRRSAPPAAAVSAGPAIPSVPSGPSAPARADGAPFPGPSLTGPNVAKVLVPKTPGQWIVDAKLGPGSDTDNLKDAFYSARDNDVITVRPGTYAAAGSTMGKTLTLVGLGKTRDEVVIEGQGTPLIEAKGGALLLKKLTLRHQGGTHYGALYGRDAKIAVVDVRFLIEKGDAAYLSKGTFSAADSVFENGDHGLNARDGQIKLERCTLSGQRYALYLTGWGARADIAATKVIGTDYGLSVIESAQAVIVDSEFTGNKESINARKNAKVSLKDCQFAANGTALRAYDGGQLELRSVKIQKSDREGLRLGANARAVLDDVTISGSGGHGASLWQNARLEAATSSFQDNSGCALEVWDAAASAKLRSAKLNANRCGVTFREGGSLDSVKSDLTGNRNGSYEFQRNSKDRVVLSGSQNKIQEAPTDGRALFGDRLKPLKAFDVGH